MEKFLPYMTKDYSVGLYCEETEDIYHSAHGALTEAYEKFVKPLDLKNVYKTNTEIRVLDICYGIGYNTKVFINESLRFDNIKINLDCVDTNSFLMKLSPFIKTKIGLLDRIRYRKHLFKNIKSYKEANKIISDKKNFSMCKYTLSQIVNYIIFESLYSSKDYQLEDNIKNTSIETENFVFFNHSLLNFWENLAKKDDKLYLFKKIKAYLHNIYYSNLSKRYKEKINIDFFAEDIRDFVKNSSKKYDIILLDGFTPSKCPCIWSEDFFRTLYDLLNLNAQLVTYNTSAVVRAAMLNAGFYIGNIFDSKNRVIGTIASNNKSLIKNNLTKKQTGLLGTKAGIPYRDKNLSLTNDLIIHNRELELANSNLESSSKYLKRCSYEI